MTSPLERLTGTGKPLAVEPPDAKEFEGLSGLHWEGLDLDLSVPGLLSSLSSGPEWLAELGRIGGRNSSAAKAAAARRNGHKGGRPRTRSRKDSMES